MTFCASNPTMHYDHHKVCERERKKETSLFDLSQQKQNKNSREPQLLILSLFFYYCY